MRVKITFNDNHSEQYKNVTEVSFPSLTIIIVKFDDLSEKLFASDRVRNMEIKE